MGRNRKWVLENKLSEAVWSTIFRGPHLPQLGRQSCSSGTQPRLSPDERVAEARARVLRLQAAMKHNSRLPAQMDLEEPEEEIPRLRAQVNVAIRQIRTAPHQTRRRGGSRDALVQLGLGIVRLGEYFLAVLDDIYILSQPERARPLCTTPWTFNCRQWRAVSCTQANQSLEQGRDSASKHG